MYINKLPYEINKELCRLLDFENYWKELAGNWMKYSAFDISYIEQKAYGEERSPTDYLLQKWGEEIYRVEELFIVLYKMKYLPALVCLRPVVEKKFHSKIKKLSEEKENGMVMEISRKRSLKQSDDSCGSIPLLVKFLERTTSSQGEKGNEEDEIRRHANAVPKISYEELMTATGDWSETNLLGKGGFGEVFKGEWKHLTVAVKRLRENNGRNEELIREMLINQCRYDDILPLYGYSLGGPEQCIVYQFMPEGSLRHRLRTKANAPLTWPQRYNIMHGVARGLQFLHTKKVPLIHCDIKPANILLDSNLMPKIGDFGAATLYKDNLIHGKVSENVRPNGTWPYLPDEYLRARSLSPAVDVFSYGVVMVEVATALPAIDKARPQQLLSMFIHQLDDEGVEMATLEDPVLRGTALSNPAMCCAFVKIGLHCTNFMRQQRPTMLEVFMKLEEMK